MKINQLLVVLKKYPTQKFSFVKEDWEKYLEIMDHVHVNLEYDYPSDSDRLLRYKYYYEFLNSIDKNPYIYFPKFIQAIVFYNKQKN
jgi:hypothetical protein